MTSQLASSVPISLDLPYITLYKVVQVYLIATLLWFLLVNDAPSYCVQLVLA